MNTVDMWRVLELEPTKDENEITSAYRSRVVVVNPEDNPEGFMELREAYEMAISYAREDDVLDDSQGEKFEEEKTDVERFVDRFAAIYEDIYSRMDMTKWDELLKDPICYELDTADVVREQTLVYMMGHFMMPHELWVRLNNVFSFVEDKDILAEKFPGDFLNYITFKAGNDDHFDYTAFSSREDYSRRYTELLPEIKIDAVPGLYKPEHYETEVDGYIRNVTFLEAHINGIVKLSNDIEIGATDLEYDPVRDRARSMDMLCSVLAHMEGYDVFHPVELGVRMRTLELAGRYEEARLLAEAVLYDELIPMDNYASAAACYTLFNLADRESGIDKSRLIETATSVTDEILERSPDAALARLVRGYIYLYQSRYEDASDIVIEVLDANQKNESAVWLLRNISRRTIADYQPRFDAGALSPKQGIELAWAYFRTDNMDMVLNVLGRIEPTPEVAFQHNNLYGRTYAMKENYVEAEPYLLRWSEDMSQIKARRDAGEELSHKDVDRLTREAFCNYMIALCEEKLEKYDAAIEYYKRAMDVAEKSGNDIDEQLYYKESYGKLLQQLGRHQEAMDVWNDMADSMDGCIPAYIHRQETAHELRNAQLVIDDYYNIIRDYPQYARAYFYAARVFLIYNQYEDVESVIQRARENDIDSDNLREIEAKLYERRGDNVQAERVYQEIISHLREGSSDLDEVAELYGEVAAFYLNYMDENGNRSRLGEVRPYIDLGQREDPNNLRLMWILTDLEEYSGREADPVYHRMFEMFPGNDAVYYEYGEYLHRKGRTEDAHAQYRKCFELNPKNNNVNNRLMQYHQDKYNDEESLEDYNQAVYYASNQLEVCDDDYYRIERALVYLDGYEIDKAEEDARKALEYKDDNIYAYNALGVCELRRRRYSEAMEAFNRAIEIMEGKDEKESPAPYTNASKTLENMGDFARAIEYLEKCIELYGSTLYRQQTLARLYTRNRDFVNANNKYTEIGEYLLGQRAKTQNLWYDLDIVRNHIRLIGTAHLSGNEPEADRRKKLLEAFLRENGYLDKNLDVKLINKNDRKKYDVAAGIYRALADFYLNDERSYALSLQYFERVIRFERFVLNKDTRIAILEVDKYHTLTKKGPKPKNASKLDHPENDATTVAEYRRYGEMYRYFAGACYAYGLREVAADIANRALECYGRAYGDVEGYCRYPQLAPLRMSDLAMIYYFAGMKDRAMQLLEGCMRVLPCESCYYGVCYDKILAQARIAELSGDIPQAIRLFKQARGLASNDVEIYMALRELEGIVQ